MSLVLVRKALAEKDTALAENAKEGLKNFSRYRNDAIMIQLKNRIEAAILEGA